MAIGKTLLPIQPSGGGGINYTVDVFTSSGTWNKPANLDYSYVMISSGGSGGGSGRRGPASTNRGGGGAFGSAVFLAKFSESELSLTEAVTVGAGGTGGAARTTNNTAGIVGGVGGASDFKHGINFRISMNGGTLGNAVSTLVTGTVSVNVSGNINAVLSHFSNQIGVGTSAISDVFRGNTFSNNAVLRIRDNASMGGQINSSNTRLNAGALSGYYSTSNVLTGQITGTAPETAAVQPTSFMTFGEFLNKFFPWFDAADANYNIGRCGLGGGCGNLAGSVAGFAGANGIHYGGGGGGGGASTDGANSGAGGNGIGGIVIVINVLTS